MNSPPHDNLPEFGPPRKRGRRPDPLVLYVDVAVASSSTAPFAFRHYVTDVIDVTSACLVARLPTIAPPTADDLTDAVRLALQACGSRPAHVVFAAADAVAVCAADALRREEIHASVVSDPWSPQPERIEGRALRAARRRTGARSIRGAEIVVHPARDVERLVVEP